MGVCKPLFFLLVSRPLLIIMLSLRAVEWHGLNLSIINNRAIAFIAAQQLAKRIVQASAPKKLPTRRS
jgi:hypothetical protein